MQIGGIPIGQEHPVFVIAELSGNHGGSLERALSIVDAAARSGATAIKLQTFTADSMTIDSDAPEFRIENPDSLWFGRTLHDLYSEAATPYEWVPVIMRRAAEQGLLCFSSPFDADAVEFLNSLGVPCFKIASLENNDFELIEAAASTGKPLLISTGATTVDEIDQSVDVARAAGCRDLALLKCTSSYPANPDDVNLRAIPMLRERYGCEVGFSDHTAGIGVSTAAVALGASIVEKHLIDSRALGGVDAAFSAEPAEMATLVDACNSARKALGVPELQVAVAERGARSRRRSLYAATDIRKGMRIRRHHVRSGRPAGGLHPKHLQAILNAQAAAEIAAGTPLAWSHLELLESDTHE